VTATKSTKAFCVLCGFLFAASLAAQDRPDRSHPPALGPSPQLNLPPIQKKALSNGLAVWLIESHEVPLVQVNLLVLAGASDDPAGKFGLASLTAAMLDEGAGSRSSLEIADAVDYLGAALTTSASADATAVRLNVPTSHFTDALPIMADVALRPTFPQQDLERIRQERLTSLLQAQDDPQSIAALAFARTVFGPAHRFGTGTIGTRSTLKAFTVDDLRSFHSTYYSPANAALIVAGDVQADGVLPMLEKQFGGWKAAAPKRIPVPVAPQLTRRQIYIVDKPGAAQSQIRIGWVGVSRSSPDYFPIVALNTILGGSFSSRLNQNLRETHGYAYVAGSAFDMRVSPGPFYAAAGVQTDKTADALREFFNELDRIPKPIPPEELTRGKNYVALGFPSGFETIGDLSQRVEELIVYKLPDDYFQNYIKNVEAVSAADVQPVAAKYIQPQKFAVVVVGDGKTIEPGIRALNLGPVRVMSVAEALGE
jgi:predicted Zn-dependent peptidase